MSGNRQCERRQRRGSAILHFVSRFLSRLCACALLAGLPGAGTGAGCGGPAARSIGSRALVPDDAVAYHVHAIDLARRGEGLAELQAEYTARLEQSPDDPIACFLAGRAARDDNSAFRLYEKALTLAPQSYWANLGLGEGYLRLAILHRAEERLKQTVQLNDELPFAHAALGEVYRQQAKLKEAIELFDRAIERDSGCFVARRGLAEIYLASGNRPGARRELQIAAALAPRDFAIQLQLATLLEEEGFGEEAAAAYRLATELNANQPRAWYGLASTAQLLERTDEAIRALERVLELQSQHQQARLELAALLREIGEAERADQLYREAIAADPEDRQARRGQAFTFAAQGRLTEALLAFHELLQLDPQDNQSAELLAELLVRIGAGELQVSGKTLQQVFDRALQAILACSSKIAEKTARPSGEIVTEVEVDAEGKVIRLDILSDTTGSPELQACAVWTIRTASFPRRQPATVTFPIELD